MNDPETTTRFLVGPFPKENFDSLKWKVIREKIYVLNSTNEEENMPYCKEFLQLLVELNSCADYDAYFGSPATKQFFFSEIFVTNAKNLIATRTFNNPTLLEISNSTLMNMVTFWVKAFKEDNPHLVEMAKVILDPQKYYFKTNNQEIFSSSGISSLGKEPSKEHLDWIASLKIGDIIDCIKEESACHRLCWLPARVSYDMENYIKVTFLNDFDRASRYLNRISNASEIARPGSRCGDYEWRLRLEKDDEIDACNTSSTWCSAVILDTRETENPENDSLVKEVYVGFRRYDEEGDREDDEGRSYFGMSKKYDDWFTVTDPRLAKKGTMVKKNQTKESLNNNEETMIDDSNDHVYNQVGGEQIFALTRQMHCRSTFMVEMINKFGELGGFDKILHRIQNTENWAPIEVVTLLLSVVGQISLLLHKDFANEYIPTLKQAVWNNIVKSPESNIRNFTKERLDEIIEACETLFKRVYSINERREFLETLNFQVCTICFDSHFLERKIQGLKTLLEMIKCLRLGTLRYTTNEIMNNYIRKNQIFEKIYGSKGHSQLIQRSVEFLKYVASEDVLQIPELDSVWNETTKGDTETKLVIYKLFSDASLYFKENHLDFLILKISEIDPSIMIADEIELVYELSRFSSKPAGFIDKARALFWKIISETSSPYPADIRELALTKFCNIMRSWDLREERLNVLYDCIENIKNEMSVIASLKILQKVIDNYPSNSATIEKFTKTSCIKHLIKEKDLQGVLLTDLRRFKENTSKKLNSTGQISEEILDGLVGERAKYITHITERLQFINFIASHSGNKDGGLSYELLSELWDVVVHQSLIPSEKNVIYKWIQETAESKTGFPMSSEDLLKFFKEKMVSKEDYETITAEGFDCFKSVFLLINEKLGNLSKVNVQSNSSPSRYSGAGPHNYDYYSTYDNEKNTKEKEFEYSVNKSPEELEGIQSVWELTLASKSEEVAEKARNLLNDLYLNVSSELHEDMIKIRVEYLNKCLSSLQDTLSQRQFQQTSNPNSDLSIFNSRCVRCLNLMTKILDESEKKGVGSLKSHSGLIKGELLSFSVANEVSWGSDVPRKIDLRVHANTTIYELRVKISQSFKVTWDQIKLLRAQQKEIKDNENGKTIGDLRIRNGEELTANKRPTKAIPQVDLVDSNGNLNPIAKRIFIDWFTTHSDNGKMSPDQCAAFINSCTNDGCRGDDRRVKDVFSSYDTDRDGFLTLEDFLDFYTSSSRQRPQVVWSNLHSHHYRNDLRKASEVEEEKVDITVLPRYILSNNVEYFQLLFSLLDFGGRVAVETWKLLNRLPTSSQLFSEIVKLKGIRENNEKDWTQILDPTSNYKLLYALEVMEYLMEDEVETEENSAEDGETGANLLWAADPQLKELRKTWQADFIYYGGFDYLFKIFHKYAAKDHKTLGTFDKNILSFILKILCNYLTAAFAPKVSNIYSCLSFIRLFHLDLDFIQNYLNKKSNPSEEKPAESVEANKNTEEKEDLKIEETPEFRSLVERLQGELGSHILSTINLKEMIKVVSELGFDILIQAADLESEDRTILEYSINILTSIFLYDKQTINYFLTLGNEGQRSSDKFVLEGIFCSRSFNIRNYFSHALYILTKNTKDYEKSLLARHYLKLFLNNLPSSKDSSKEDCNQYFELLCKLLEEIYTGDSNLTDDSLNFEELVGMVIQRIKEHSSNEDRRNLLLVDKAFTGLLQLCERILDVKPELKQAAGSVEKYNLIEELFNTCLFDTRDPDASFGDLDAGKDSKSVQEPVKCKSKESRQIAYKLLLTLCRGNQANLMILLRCLEGLMKCIMRLNAAQDWNYSPSSDVKSLYGYVGIRNPRCICYMNAMLQQFFMTPTFRYGLLAADDKKQKNMVKNSEGIEIDDNVLHQLQNMFGFLELSDRQDYDSHEFCFSFKDYSGQPVNISIQQDTQEFLNMIFDKLENGLKETPFKNILQGVYGGKTTNQTICHGCGTVREREDIFYNLSVEVKNMKTIYESFEKFITGEIIEDYNCESCNKKNSITKRTCLSSLPNVLIVHLQRIVFDLDTLMNQKINSRLEFPFELNLEPYTKESLAKKDKEKKKGGKPKGEEDEEGVKPQRNISESFEEEGKGKAQENQAQEEVEHEKDYYEYKLAGVLVHDGTAEFGHYYSYINTNRGDIRGQKGSSEKDKWLEFNDSTIRSFNTKSIEAECFGGEGNDSNDDNWGWSKFGRENSKNAYILVYERVLKDPLKLTVSDAEDEAYLRRVLNVEQLEKEDPKSIQISKEEVEGKDGNKTAVTTYECDYFALKGFIPSSIYKKVWEGNHKFMFEQHIYNDDFFNFIKEVCNSLSLPPAQQGAYSVIHPMHNTIDPETKQNVQNLIQILSHLIFHLLAKSSESDVIVSLSFVLRNLASLVPEAAFTFFESLAVHETKYIIQLFLNCPSRLVRHYTSQALLQSINIMIAYHNLTLNLGDLYVKNGQKDTLSEAELKVLKIETEIVDFLDNLIAAIPTEAAKNWTKVGQFFEFWKDFVNSGEAQMHYLFQKEFIAVLIDFYLDKRSPLVGFSEKKHTIGNRYSEPELNALVQTVSYMIRRAKVTTKSGNLPFTSSGLQGFPLYDLSENDEKCLQCSEYYDKAIKDKYDFYAVGVTIQHFAYENENFSWMISNLIIYGLNKCTSDDAKPYLEAMSYLVSLNDYIQPRRLEWIFGFPQPLFQSGRFGSDSFGLYGNYSLDEVVVNYDTPLSVNGCTSLINVILQNRKRMESMSMICLKQILLLADINDVVFKFFVSLPPPSYLYAKFSDWVPAFIDYFLADCKRYYTSYSKEELGIEGQKYWHNLEKKIAAKLEVHEKELQKALSEEAEQEDPTVLKGFFPNYIIGRTFKSEEIDKIPYEQSQDSNEVSLRTQEIYCYITDSKPTSATNLAFPRSVVDDASLKSYDIKANSPLALFIQPRGVQSSMDSNKSIQNVLQNEVEAILAQAKVSESTKSNTSGSPNPQQRNLDVSTDAEGSPQKEKPATKEIVEISKSCPIEEDFDFTYEVNPVIRRFYLKNDSPHSLHCQLGIFPKSKSFMNFRIPSSIVNVNVRPHSSTCILSISKIFPQLAWGDYEVRYYIQGLENQEYGGSENYQRSTNNTRNAGNSSDFVEDRYNDLLN